MGSQLFTLDLKTHQLTSNLTKLLEEGNDEGSGDMTFIVNEERFHAHSAIGM